MLGCTAILPCRARADADAADGVEVLADEHPAALLLEAVHVEHLAEHRLRVCNTDAF